MRVATSSKWHCLYLVFLSSDRTTPVLLPRAPQRSDHSVISSAQLVLPPNCRDVTAERVGTVMAIVGRRSRRRTTRASLAGALFR
jgi:hypothetical protein